MQIFAFQRKMIHLLSFYAHEYIYLLSWFGDVTSELGA